MPSYVNLKFPTYRCKSTVLSLNVMCGAHGRHLMREKKTRIDGACVLPRYKTYPSMHDNIHFIDHRKRGTIFWPCKRFAHLLITWLAATDRESRLKLAKKKTTAPRIPAWSPTVVLTERHSGYCNCADRTGCGVFEVLWPWMLNVSVEVLICLFYWAFSDALWQLCQLSLPSETTTMHT